MKRRAAAKGWVTRQLKSLNAVLDKPDVGVVELREAMESLGQRLAALDEVQAEIEVELDPEDLEADLDAAHQFREETTARLAAARQKLQESDEDVRSVRSGESTSAARAKLPKLELPKFRGEVTEWQTFWDQFTSHIDETDMPLISKFSYLLSLLEGEAKVCVQGLSLTSANYKAACDLLKDRYGRPERIVFHHVQALLNGGVPLKSKGSKYVSRLWSMRDEFMTHIRSLEALGVSGKQCETFLTPIILSRLPSEIRLEWARRGAGRESDLEWLLRFLQEEIESIERSETFKDVSTVKAESSNVSDHGRNSTHLGSRVSKERLSSASALHVASSEVSKSCVFCNKKHKSENCFEVLRLKDKERAERIRLAGVCYRCLCKGHLAKGCLGKCSKCGGSHNVIMCGVRLSPRNVTEDSTKVTGVGTLNTTTIDNTSQPVDNLCTKSATHAAASLYNATSSKLCTVLQTATVEVVGADGRTHKAKLLFDNGSDRTYVTRRLVQECQPKWIGSEVSTYSAFGGHKSGKNALRNIFELQVLDSASVPRSFRAIEVPVISEPLFRPIVPSSIIKEFGVKFVDDYLFNQEVQIDILVGLDLYWSLVKVEGAIQINTLVALDTIFGYTLSGKWHTTSPSLMSYSQFLCISRVSDFEVERFWDLESVGVNVKEVDSSSSVLQDFNENVSFVHGRYEVALPWKSEVFKGELVDNVDIALKRLSKLHNKLDQDVVLRGEYYDVFEDYEKHNIIEEVPCSDLHTEKITFYMPHRPVIKESSISTKIRPVFDCSAKNGNGVSLNDCLHTGPSLNPELVEVLLRFRRWPIAISGDISKAFLQISVKRGDRDAHRFLLKGEKGTGNSVRHMRFLRVPFGNTSSPFLLNATIKNHLSKYSLTEVINDLDHDMYVDNWLSGADSTDEAYRKFAEACTVLSHAGMSLTKWVSNDAALVAKFNDGFGTKDGVGYSSILGLHWCNTTDTFSFQGVEVTSQFSFSCTKRTVLSMIARIFDPLGLISPFVVYGKILFQDVWRLGLSWDDVLPLDVKNKFRRWMESSVHFKGWSVNRCYFHNLPWKTLPSLELHAFGDASEKAYGACVYVRTCSASGSYQTALVASRSRVAPIKTITLPRLELLGALLCARLVTFVKKALKLQDDISLFCWTDSRIVLSWIQGDPYRWKMFVTNRVTEIQNVTPPSCWHHCSSQDNPADLISRGLLADQLVSHSLWMTGPHRLLSPLASTQEEEGYCTEEEVGVCEASVAYVVNSSSPLFELSRWSHLSKAIRIVAWVLRFVTNCKHHNCKQFGVLTTEELNQARTQIIYVNQREVYAQEISNLECNKSLPKGSPLRNLDPFLDEKGLLRVKGRLEYAELCFESKHPIIIPKGHFAKLLIRFQHTFLKHGGVTTVLSTLRANFWICGGRSLVKSVIRECVKCRRHDSRPCTQVSPCLPACRVTATPPFSVTGIDFAGPLFCADHPSKKFYILLFTCAVVRAVHLELTDSMFLVDCMLAIRRFTSRRGFPSVIYSDNFKTFKACTRELQKVYGHLAPQWKFIVPRSPWWGGWWERLIRSVKYALRKSLGGNYVSRSELETNIHEVEACINSRPLTYVEDNPDVSHPLSPSHFLTGRSAGFQIEADLFTTPVTQKLLCNHEVLQKQRVDKFWKVWSDMYIRNLPPVVKNFKANCNLKPGDVVLLKEENASRLKWPLGVVISVFPDKSGIVRTVKLRTANGVLMRSVQNLYNLEISSSPQETCKEEEFQPAKDIDLPSVTCHKQTTRSGRVVKAPCKLDI